MDRIIYIIRDLAVITMNSQECLSEDTLNDNMQDYHGQSFIEECTSINDFCQTTHWSITALLRYYKYVNFHPMLLQSRFQAYNLRQTKAITPSLHYPIVNITTGVNNRHQLKHRPHLSFKHTDGDNYNNVTGSNHCPIPLLVITIDVLHRKYYY